MCPLKSDLELIMYETHFENLEFNHPITCGTWKFVKSLQEVMYSSYGYMVGKLVPTLNTDIIDKIEAFEMKFEM